MKHSKVWVTITVFMLFTILTGLLIPVAQWVSPPYGYVVWDINNNLVCIRDRVITYYLNPQNNDGLATDIVESTIITAANTWMEDDGATFNHLSYGGINESLNIDVVAINESGTWRLYRVSDNTQGINSVLFDDFEDNASSGYLAVVFPSEWNIIHSEEDFTIVALLEADMVFNDAYQFRVDGYDYDLLTVALHEFGHFGPGLGDVYATSTDIEDTRQVMYAYTGVKRELRWGDIAGLRWHYPRIYGGYNLYPVYTISGADTAVQDLDGDGGIDMVYIWGEYDSSEDDTHIWARVAWDLDPLTGVPSQVYGFKLIHITSGRVRDIGAAFGDINRNGIIDLIVSFTNETRAYYMVLFDVTATTDHTWSWQSQSEIYGVPGSIGDYGTDVLLIDIDVNGVLDHVVINSFYSTSTGDYYLWYYIGWNLNTNGVADSWDARGTSSITLFSYVGCAAIQPANRIYVIGSAASGNYITYRIVRVNATGYIVENITKRAPLYVMPNLRGFGMDSIDVGNYQYLDIVLLWVDDTYSYSIIEWESRIDSHP